MNKKDIYKIWAPTNKLWVDWVRPVAFIDLDTPKDINEIIDYEIPVIPYIDTLKQDTAIFIDVDGPTSIKEGISLANLGYRPIPLFNGTHPNEGAISTTNNEIIEPFLVWGAYELLNIEIKDDAPPAFLLDSNRLNRYKYSKGIFDNSWDLYYQDIPSHNYLLSKGIKNIIVRGNKFNRDLKLILYRFQKNGIKIYFTNGFEEPKLIKVRKPRYSEIM